MDNMELTTDEQQMIRHQFHQVTLDVEQWMRLSARWLAHTSKMAALVTAPSATQTRFKHVELIAISETVAMMVLVLQAGTVKQQMFIRPNWSSQEELRRVANRLNEKCCGRNSKEIKDSIRTLERLCAGHRPADSQIIEQMDHRTSREIIGMGCSTFYASPNLSSFERCSNCWKYWSSVRC